MKDEYGDEIMDSTVQPTAASIVTALAGEVALLDSLRLHQAAAVEQEIGASMQPAHDLMNVIGVQIREYLGSTIQPAIDCEQYVCSWIAAQIAAAQATAGMCQGVVDRHVKRLQKKCKPATISATDAAPALPASPQSTLETPTPQGASTHAGGICPPASSFMADTVFPAAPTPAELHGLGIRYTGDAGYMDVSQIPGVLWDWQNPDRFFFSVQPTPFSRCEITCWRDLEGKWVKTGVIYINFSVPIDGNRIQSLIAAMNVDQSMVSPYSDLEAYTNAVACFSVNVVNALWEAAGIPIPATMQPVIPEVTNADLGLPEGSMTAGSAAPDDPLDPPSVIEGGIRRVLGGVRGIAAGAVPAAPNVAVIAERIGLRLPTWQDLCTIMTPVYQSFGIDPSTVPPCASLDDMRRAFMRRLNGH